MPENGSSAPPDLSDGNEALFLTMISRSGEPFALLVRDADGRSFLFTPGLDTDVAGLAPARAVEEGLGVEVTELLGLSPGQIYDRTTRVREATGIWLPSESPADT